MFLKKFFDTITWYQVFLYNPNNWHTVVWFQVTARLELELDYYETAVQHFSHYTTGTEVFG